MPKYLYQRNGAPILSWRGGTAPQQTRAADAKALGSLGEPTLILPRAGAPEPLPPLAGCECKGTVSGIIGQPMGDAFSLALPYGGKMQGQFVEATLGDPYSMAIPWGGKMRGQYVKAVPLSGITDTIANLPTVAKVGLAVGAFFLYKKLKKK